MYVNKMQKCYFWENCFKIKNTTKGSLLPFVPSPNTSGTVKVIIQFLSGLLLLLRLTMGAKILLSEVRWICLIVEVFTSSENKFCPLPNSLCLAPPSTDSSQEGINRNKAGLLGPWFSAALTPKYSGAWEVINKPKTDCSQGHTYWVCLTFSVPSLVICLA